MRAMMLLAALLLGCSDAPAKKYTNYQECFDDKVDRQMRDKVETIVQCCIDHELTSGKPPHCGADESECINYLTNNLDSIDADIQLKMQGCAAYVAEKN